MRFLIFFPQLKLQLASHVWTSEREKESRQPKIPIRELWNGSLSETKLEQDHKNFDSALYASGYQGIKLVGTNMSHFNLGHKLLNLLLSLTILAYYLQL